MKSVNQAATHSYVHESTSIVVVTYSVFVTGLAWLSDYINTDNEYTIIHTDISFHSYNGTGLLLLAMASGNSYIIWVNDGDLDS